MNPSVIIIGFTVGLLVGMTGMGGGALMTPLLILTGWARPVMAVGTDLVWGTVTKAVGAFVHRRQGTVNFTIVRRLAMGSIPGAIAGIWVIQKLRHLESGEFVDQLVMRFLGAALMTVAVVMIIRMIRRSDHRRVQDALAGEGGERPSQEGLTVLIGLVIGFLVGVTSVGSGSLIMVALLTLYPRERLRRLVGTDVFHALLLVGTAAVGHWSMGNVDVRLLAGLLLGSIPGVWIGSKATMYMPERALRPVLAVILFGLGYKLI